MVQKPLGEFIHFFQIPKNGKQSAKVFETIKLNKNLMPII